LSVTVDGYRAGRHSAGWS